MASPTPKIDLKPLDDYPLKDIAQPHPHDVLCGRGGGTNAHVGNSHWRMLVAANKELYVSLPKRQKMLLSKSIINAVRCQNPPGRFLQKAPKTDLWYDVGDQRAQEKTSQALREGPPGARKKKNESSAESPGNSALPSNSLPSPSAQQQPQSQLASGAAAPTYPVPPNPKPIYSAAPAIPGPGVPSTANNIATPAMTNSAAHSIQEGPGMNAYGIASTDCGAKGVPAHLAMYMNQQTIYASEQSARPAYVPGSDEDDLQPLDAFTEAAYNVAPPSFDPNGELSFGSVITMDEIEEAKLLAGYSFGDMSAQNQPRVHFSKDNLKDKRIDENAPVVPPVDGGLEPVGLSFGTIGTMGSAMSLGTMGTITSNPLMSSKLESGGLSFGSCMSFSVKAEEVDGGLEAVGTSFGSMSLVDQNTRTNQYAERPTGSAPKQQEEEAVPLPVLLQQQKSKGNLLECSDTESDEGEEQSAQQSAQKSQEWENLKAAVETQNCAPLNAPFAPPSFPMNDTPTTLQFPNTNFDRDVSALGCEDFGPQIMPPETTAEVTQNDCDGEDAANMPPPAPMIKQTSDVNLETYLSR